MRRLAAVPTSLLIVILAAVGCRGPENATEDKGGWVGTITTEDDVTTVVNESGSVWGGKATLIEEASIGVDLGADEYMFGRVDSLWATDDEIFVLDSQVPAMRVYDHEGTYLRDIGGAGQGPGEYARPFSIGADASGRLFVADVVNGRISIYSSDGEYLEDWPAGGFQCCGTPMVITEDGVPYLSVRDPEAWERSEDAYSMQAFGPEGAYGPLLEVAPVRWTVDRSVIKQS